MKIINNEFSHLLVGVFTLLELNRIQNLLIGMPWSIVKGFLKFSEGKLL